MLCCDWFKYTTIPQSFATGKNRSRSPTKVRHIGWQLANAREYLLTSVASTVSRRIYIYIRGCEVLEWCKLLFLLNRWNFRQQHWCIISIFTMLVINFTKYCFYVSASILRWDAFNSEYQSDVQSWTFQLHPAANWPSIDRVKLTDWRRVFPIIFNIHRIAALV